MKSDHWPKLHIQSLSTPRGWNWAYFRSTGNGFRNTGHFSKLPYLGIKLGNWPKFQKFHIYSDSSYPMGSKLSLFLLHGQRFWDTVQFSKLPSIFGHETWLLVKVPEVAHILFFLSRRGGEIELIFGLRAAVSEIQTNFQNCHIWAWHLASGQSERSCTYTLLLSREVEIELMSGLRAAVTEIWADFQNCHIWAWNLVTDKRFRNCIYTLFLPHGAKLSLFSLYRAAVFEIQANFQNCHPYLDKKLGHWPKF